MFECLHLNCILWLLFLSVVDSFVLFPSVSSQLFVYHSQKMSTRRSNRLLARFEEATREEAAAAAACGRGVTSRLLEAGPAYVWQLNQDTDYPHRPTHVFSAHFVLTRARPGRTSRSVTHPKIAPGQARLTSEFFGDRLPEKKLQLVDMSILIILLSPGSGCHNDEMHSTPKQLR